MRRVYTVLQIERLVDLNSEPSYNYKVRVSVTSQWEGRVTLKGHVFSRVRAILTRHGEIIYSVEKRKNNAWMLLYLFEESHRQIVRSFDRLIYKSHEDPSVFYPCKNKLCVTFMCNEGWYKAWSIRKNLITRIRIRIIRFIRSIHSITRNANHTLHLFLTKLKWKIIFSRSFERYFFFLSFDEKQNEKNQR